MKDTTEKKHENVAEWSGDTPAAFTIYDLKNYLGSLRTFLAYEQNKGALTVVEASAISAEIQAWRNFLSLLNRIKTTKKIIDETQEV